MPTSVLQIRISKRVIVMAIPGTWTVHCVGSLDDHWWLAPHDPDAHRLANAIPCGMLHVHRAAMNVPNKAHLFDIGV